jgi:adenine-specific DNA-methyltransferase
MGKTTSSKTVETLTHDDATRKLIPTAEYQPLLSERDQSPIRVAYERRNRDLDPQLVWRGKDDKDWSELIVHAPPLYIQEQVQPKALIDDLLRRSKADQHAAKDQHDLFVYFQVKADDEATTEFYQHDANWSNRMILGDSLQVMASLAEREGLRGKVQCIYLDPPYGIKFNSNFQWSTTSRDVKDGKTDHITREPEQVKAFRDTWRDGIHSYLTYLRDRLTVARDLLAESGSIFVQIGDENVHRVRALMDDVFGEENFISSINYVTTSGRQDKFIDNISNHIVWFSKRFNTAKYRQLYFERPGYTEEFIADQLQSDGLRTDGDFELKVHGRVFTPKTGNHWKVKQQGAIRVGKADRLIPQNAMVRYKRFSSDFPVRSMPSVWNDTSGGAGKDKIYVVQSNSRLSERCILMTTDPGDLVLDPTCGSGTTAYMAEQWGRRWITIDTSRVALALARARIMGAKYPYYLLADSRDGQFKEAEVAKSAPSNKPTRGDIRHGFVYERVPHVTLKSIANNAEIDVIWEEHQSRLEPLRSALNTALGKAWEEWEIPREAGEAWPKPAKDAHAAWWAQRIARQKEIDASIAAKAEFEYLYDKPYEDKKKVRVAGPFTVESLSPHRVLIVDENDELIDPRAAVEKKADPEGFVRMILDNLRTAGVQQAHKEDKIFFTALTPWPGDRVCAEGRYSEASGGASSEAGKEKRAAIFIGPEFGTVSRPDLVEAAREAADAGFDVLIACAFNYDAHSTEFNKLGRVPVLKARMNADLHMAEDLKNTGKGNLFVIFGEPDIDIIETKDGRIQVKVNGVDVFHPNTGEVRSDGAEGVACWFIDTDYSEESFFVRHAYFLGANDPYKSLKTTLKAEINQEAWETLNSDTSRPFDKPKSGRIAVKVINHLGDEVMKVFRV